MAHPEAQGTNIPAIVRKSSAGALLDALRKVFPDLLSYPDTRQILLLTGLRRSGKTTLLFRLVEVLLLRGVPPYRILYYSFDEARLDSDELLKTYQTAKRDSSRGNVFSGDVVHHSGMGCPADYLCESCNRREE